MNKDAIALLRSRLAIVKERWHQLLRGEPSSTPLGRESTVPFLMDATFLQLMHALESADGIAWLGRSPVTIAPLHLYLQCGLLPVRRFFQAGEESLRAAAAPMPAADLEQVLMVFHTLAQREIDTLCRACEHSTLPSCELRKLPANDRSPPP